MAGREETPLDQEVFDKTLEAELAKGTDRRVAEGRAKSAAVRAYRKVHGEPERPPTAPAAARPAAAAVAAGQAPAAVAAAPLAAAGPAVAVAQVVPAAPPPTGRPPSPKPGAPDKHRLLALVPPEGIQRVEREQGDRINV